MKKAVLLFILIGLCAAVGKSWYWVKSGFALCRLQGWNQSLPGIWWNEESDAAIGQTFYYLSRGRQNFAFLSQDGKYVLKLPRANHFQAPFWMRVVSGRRVMPIREMRERFLLNSFRLSIEELPEQTGVIGMHLSKGGLAGRTVRIVDRIGRSFELPLEKAYFVLQRAKPDLIRDVFNSPPEEAERCLDLFVELLRERAKKGVINKDGSFLRNFAFDAIRAYQIDIGSFYQIEGLSKEETYRKSIHSNAGPLKCWLEQKHPEWVETLDRKLEAAYNADLQEVK